MNFPFQHLGPYQLWPNPVQIDHPRISFSSLASSSCSVGSQPKQYIWLRGFSRFFFYMCVLPSCMDVDCMCAWWPWRWEECVTFLETRVTASCEPPCGSDNRAQVLTRAAHTLYSWAIVPTSTWFIKTQVWLSRSPHPFLGCFLPRSLSKMSFNKLQSCFTLACLKPSFSGVNQESGFA